MSDNKLLDAALYYADHFGYSVIPIREDGSKKPYVKWEQYQKEKASPDTIKMWWTAHPGASIGIVTGEISGISVIDVDLHKMNDEEVSDYMQKFQEVLTPTATSPRKGLHYYFKYCKDLPNKANIYKHVDGRNDGNYIIAPPSKNGAGKYSWIEGKKITEMPLNEIPAIYINYFYSLRTVTTTQSTTQENDDTEYFKEGRRDEDLFTVANALIRSKANDRFARQTLNIIAKNLGLDITEKLVIEKIESAIKRVDRSEKALADEVKEWVLSSNGDFMSSEVTKELGLSSRVDIKNLSKILSRLAEQGVIEKVGSKRGSWRRINREYSEQCWWNDEGVELPLRFPLGVEDFAKVYRGNVILLEGQKSQGKSAFAIEFCRMNYHLFPEKALYQNIEMSDSELLNRFKSYDTVFTMDQWRNAVTFIRQSGEWWDKINPDGLNVVDYLLEYEKTYLIAEYVWKIHQKLKNGIALVIIQRDPLKPYGTGGRGVRDIPRLVLSLIHHQIKLEDVKSFHMTMGQNPTGLVRKYKQASWWHFKPDGEWDFQTEEKYNYFKKGKKDEKD